MKQVAYNSQQQQHKTPFGAVSTEQSVPFIHVSKTCGATGVRLVYRRDGTADSQTVSMAIAAETDPWQQYACTFTIPAPGLYFYRFEIETAAAPPVLRPVQNGENRHGRLAGRVAADGVRRRFIATRPEAASCTRFSRTGLAAAKNIRPARRQTRVPSTKTGTTFPDFIYNTPDYKGNDYYCGNLQGIIKQLDYLQRLASHHAVPEPGV